MDDLVFNDLIDDVLGAVPIGGRALVGVMELRGGERQGSMMIDVMVEVVDRRCGATVVFPASTLSRSSSFGTR